MGLIAISDVKPFLKITSSSYDTLLTAIAGKVNKFIDTRINRTLDLTTYTELYDGTGTDKLILDHYPIVTLNLISEDIDIENRTYSSVITQNLLVVDKESGIIEYVNGVFIQSQRSIYISYTAGYNTYPADLQLVAVDLAAKKYYDVQEKRQGIQSKNIMQENISFDLSDLNKEHNKILNLYRKRPGKLGIAVTALTSS